MWNRGSSGGQVEQGIQQIVSASALLNIGRGWADDGPVGGEHALGAAVVLNRADPIEIRRQRPIRTAQPPCRRPRLQIQRLVVRRLEREGRFADALQPDRERHQSGNEQEDSKETRWFHRRSKCNHDGTKTWRLRGLLSSII
jgi:hypothetical protein